MWTEPKQMPFTKQDVINALSNFNIVGVDYMDCWSGSAHKYYHIAFGSEEFQDGGKHHDNNQYYFVEECQKVFAAMEQELLKENIVFVRRKLYFSRGYDACWHSVRTDEIECVTQIVRIKPCDSFNKLQEWLKKYANFDLKITDLFECDACKKRDSISYSNYHYYAKDERYIANLLKAILTTYKKGKKVVAEIVEDSHIDNDPYRYEYEQYGYKRTELHVTISTPTGRNAIKIR